MDALDINLTDYLKYALALVFVLSLIGLVAVIARRAGFGLSTTIHGKRQRRLGIVESMNVDGKRKLVLIKRDSTEHLILLGTDSDLLIESAAAPQQNAFTQALNDVAQTPRATGSSPRARIDIPSPPGNAVGPSGAKDPEQRS